MLCVCDNKLCLSSTCWTRNTIQLRWTANCPITVRMVYTLNMFGNGLCLDKLVSGLDLKLISISKIILGSSTFLINLTKYSAEMFSFQVMLRSAVYQKYPLGGTSYFFAISLGRVVVPSPQITIKLPMTYEKLHCRVESYQLNGYRDPLVHTDRHTHTDPFTLL